MNSIGDPVSSSGIPPAGRVGRIVIATLFVLLIVLAWAEVPWQFPFFGAGVASAFVFQVAVRPRRWEILVVLAGGAALVLLDHFAIHPGSQQNLHIGPWMGFVGLVSFLVVGLRAIWAEGEEKQQLIRSILMPAAGFAFFVLASQHLLNLGSLLFPKTLDVYAYAFDGSLGFQPSFVVGRWFRDHPGFGIVEIRLYAGIPLAMAVAYGAHLRRKASSPFLLLEIFMASGLLGYFLYLAFPAAGPLYLTGWQFPGQPIPFAEVREMVLRGLEPRMIDMSPVIVRNAMPSLHMAWALLIAFNCRQFRFLRWLAYAYVLVTVVATLGTGEHYLIDLVVAFPFAAAMQALCTHAKPLKSPERLLPLVGGTMLTLVWLILLRYSTRIFFLWSPVVPWTSIMATVVLSLVWMSRIVSVEQSAPQNVGKMAGAAAAGV